MSEKPIYTEEQMNGLLTEFGLAVKERDSLLEAVETVRHALKSADQVLIYESLEILTETASTVRQNVEQRRAHKGEKDEKDITGADVQVVHLQSGRTYSPSQAQDEGGRG